MTSFLNCTCRTARLPLRLPSNSSSLSVHVRNLHAQGSVDPKSRIPTPRPPYTDPTLLLSALQRPALKAHAAKFPTWQELFSKTGGEMRDLGLAVGERRYLMWVLEKYRQGEDIEKIVVAPKPKKKIRGWGPKVQFGKRIR